MSRIAKLITVLVILLFGLAFHLKNNQLIAVNYYLGEIELPLSLIIVLILIAGSLLGILASLPAIIKLKQQNLKLDKQVKNNEKEINNLRVMPVKD